MSISSNVDFLTPTQIQFLHKHYNIMLLCGMESIYSIVLFRTVYKW